MKNQAIKLMEKQLKIRNTMANDIITEATEALKVLGLESMLTTGAVNTIEKIVEVEKIVEKIVEVEVEIEKIVEVEKIVKVEVDKEIIKTVEVKKDCDKCRTKKAHKKLKEQVAELKKEKDILVEAIDSKDAYIIELETEIAKLKAKKKTPKERAVEVFNEVLESEIVEEEVTPISDIPDFEPSAEELEYIKQMNSVRDEEEKEASNNVVKQQVVVASDELKIVKISEVGGYGAKTIFGMYKNVPFEACTSMKEIMVYDVNNYSMKSEIEKALVDSKMLYAKRESKDANKVESVEGACHRVGKHKLMGFVMFKNRPMCFVFNTGFKNGKGHPTVCDLATRLQNQKAQFVSTATTKSWSLEGAIKKLIKAHDENTVANIEQLNNEIGSFFNETIVSRSQQLNNLAAGFNKTEEEKNETSLVDDNNAKASELSNNNSSMPSFDDNDMFSYDDME